MAEFSSDKLKQQHETALDRFKLAVEVWGPQRAREHEALKFQAGDQWPEAVKTARAGSPGGQGTAAVPPRPMLTMRALDQPIAQIVNQARQMSLAAKVLPRGDGDIDTAEVFEGKIRRIEADSHAQTAYLWAFERMVPCGFGVFRINKAWKHEAGTDNLAEKWDQVLTIERVLNQAAVYLDPLAQMVDWSDGAWAFETSDLRVSQYKRDHNDTKLADLGADDATFTSEGDALKEWVIGEGEEKVYRIASYWFVEYDEREEKDPNDPTRTRTFRQKRVMWGRLNGIEWIDEPQEWDGPDIPLVPMISKEYNINGVRMFEGIVGPAMDPCRMVNYGASGLIESTGLTTRPKWVGYKGQFEGLDQMWDEANSRNLTKLEARAVTDDTGSQILPLPQLVAPEPPIQAMTQMIAVFTNFVRSTTGVPDAALGHVNPNDRSGRALEELKKASEQGTGNNIDALARAIKRSGEILVRLIPKIYDREGREMQLLAADGAPSSVTLGQPREQGQGIPPKPPIDLRKGQYAVVVDIGKNFATRRQEAQSGMTELAHAAPGLVPRFADLWVKSMDIPEGEAIADRLKPPGTDDKNIPPQVQQMVAQMQQQLQQATQIIQTKQVEQQASIEIARMNNESREKIAGMGLTSAEAKINSSDAQALLQDQFDRLELFVKAQMDEMARRADQAHEMAQTQLSGAHEAGMSAANASRDAQMQQSTQGHERGMSERGHQQSLEQGAQGHAQALEQGDMGHQQALEQQESAAALAPEPTA